MGKPSLARPRKRAACGSGLNSVKTVVRDGRAGAGAEGSVSVSEASFAKGPSVNEKRFT